MCNVKCVCALHGSKMFSDNFTRAAWLLGSHVHSSCLKPHWTWKCLFERNEWWCLMADGREFTGSRLDKVSRYPSKNKLDKTHQSRTKMWLKGFPNNKQASNVTDQIKCLLAAESTRLQLQSLCFGPVTALWFSFLLASPLPTVNSNIS